MGEQPVYHGKHCTKCHVWKPWSAFRKDATREDGYNAWCAKCKSENDKEWYRRNREAKLAKVSEYSHKNRDARNAKDRRRRARIRQNGGTHSQAEWVALVVHYECRCVRCGVVPRGGLDGMTKDHIIPIAQGGTNDIGNLQPLCSSCNTIKGQDTTDYRTRWVIASGEMAASD